MHLIFTENVENLILSIKKKFLFIGNKKELCNLHLINTKSSREKKSLNSTLVFKTNREQEQKNARFSYFRQEKNKFTKSASRLPTLYL